MEFKVLKEMTVNEWLKSMASEGFTGKFNASNHEFVINGRLEQDGNEVKILITDKKRKN